MGKKLVAGMLLLLLFCVSGCAAYGSRGGQTTTPVPAEIPKDTEFIEGMKTSKTPAGGTTVSQQNEDLLELKHWKYGSDRAEPSTQQAPDQPVPPQQPQLPVMDEPVDSWETVSIPIISEEEMVQTIRQLIDLGYLTEPVSNQDFQAAIRKFQSDNSLPITGKLDGSTRELLKGK